MQAIHQPGHAGFGTGGSARLGRRLATLACLATLGWAVQPAHAAVITLSDLNIFRDYRAANDVGLGQGDVFQYGANVSGGSAGYKIQGIFTPGNGGQQVFSAVQNCGPLAVNANFCAGGIGFNTARTQGTWQVHLFNGLVDLFASLPNTTSIPASTVPFPTDVRITANGSTPTINWTLNGYTPDSLRVQIFDKSDIRANGTANIIHSINLPPGTTSYTFPALLSSSSTGNPVNLIPGHSYAINFQVIDTRNNLPIAPGAGNAQILTRSNSFFDFSPPLPGQPPVIELPQISGDNKVYQFKVGAVGPNSVTFIDPAVAVGYDYAIGAGDPDFASVVLPNVGDNHYMLHYVSGGNAFDIALDGGIQYFFPGAGVDAFSVTGIETSAMLDPGNAGAFVTGLTFATNGQFTGTMTPIVVDVNPSVPEPGSLLLLGLALGSIAITRRRPQAGPRKRPA